MSAYDVVVVGGGFSGMAAANYLHEHSITNFIVLEARERLGGRTFTIHVPEDKKSSHTDIHSIDLGGAYVGATQNRLIRFLKEFGLKTKRVYSSSKFVIQMNVGGRDDIVSPSPILHPFRLEHEGTVPFNLNPFVLLDMNFLLVETHRLSMLVDTKAPWDSPLNKALCNEDGLSYDELTVHQWVLLKAQTTLGAQLYKSSVSGILCVETHEVSMLFWLFYVAGGKGVMRLIETDKGAQERKVVGGTMQICDLIADKIGRKRVKLRTPVGEIRYGEGNGGDGSVVTVRSHNGDVYRCRSVIVALSPSLYSSISFSPPLPPPKSLASRRMYMGSIIKTITRFRVPYWRNNGFNGTVLSNQGPISYSYDDCHHVGGEKMYEGAVDEKWNNANRKYVDGTPFYAIMGFVLGDVGREYMKVSKEERMSAIAKQYSSAFKGEGRDAEPIDYWEQNWDSEDFSRGCYVGVMPPGLLSTLREDLRSSISHCIFFGGTELATAHAGYMDGAIQSGERAAHQTMQYNLFEGKSNDSKRKALGDFEEECPVDETQDMVPVPMDPKWYEMMLPRPNTVKGVLYLGVWAAIAAVWWMKK